MHTKSKECSYRISLAALEGKVEEMKQVGWIEFSRQLLNFDNHQNHGAPPLYKVVFRKLESSKRRPRVSRLKKRMNMICEAVQSSRTTGRW